MQNVRPIIMSAPMVKALLDGRKTQTRRVLKPQPPKDEYGDDYITHLNGPEWYEPAVITKDGEMVPGKPIWGVYDDYGDFGTRVPYMPGDILWVRERHRVAGNEDHRAREIIYAADGGSGPWRSSIHMCRRLSRLTLEVTDVRVQRLRDISHNDAIAEGIEPVSELNAGNQRWRDYLGLRSFCISPILSFSTLWDSLNGRRLGFSWADNPWIVAITFRVHKMNIDEFLARQKHDAGIDNRLQSIG